MAAEPAPEPWSRLSELIALKTGLHFPPQRHPDLQRALTCVAREFDLEDAATCADWLLSAPLTGPRLRALASHLTVGETYFFRDRSTFDALAEYILPALIRRRAGERELRLWSAACCTGEEAYSLAILVQQCLPDWREWRITLLATDINQTFLRKAVAGVYGEWSFRDAPAGFKERCFTRGADGRYTLLPQIRQMVTFADQNLVDDATSPADGRAMDLIFCRNVLMYFTPPQAHSVVAKLRDALADDGCLVVGPSEGSQALLRGFAARIFPGAILYQKESSHAVAASPARAAAKTPQFLPPSLAPSAAAPAPPLPNAASGEPARQRSGAQAAAVHAQSYEAASRLYRQGRYAPAADVLLASMDTAATAQPQALSLLSRAFANLGRLDQALAWCDRWIAADALDSTSRYLRATILLELGDTEKARRALKHAIYLDPGLTLAHVALGNLARAGGRTAEAAKHFGNALASLGQATPDDPLPQADGLTVGRMQEILTSLLASEAIR